MFDLEKFCSEGNPGYKQSKILVDGTLDYGILIGENQSITLGCTEEGYVACSSVEDSPRNTVAVVIGSTDDSTLTGTYTGKLKLDSSFKVMQQHSFYKAIGV
jgi:hypothetical protein